MGGEVGREPGVLGRALGAAALHDGAVAIEHDQVPAPDFVAVIAAAGVAGGGAEVGEIVAASGGAVVVVADSGTDAGLQGSPFGFEAASELGGRTGFVDGVSEGGYSAAVRREERRHAFIASAGAVADVPDGPEGGAGDG